MFISIFLSCNTIQNHPGVSNDIAESKKRGVFICEYQADHNPLRINDSIEFIVKIAWLERQWKYPENLEKTSPMEGYQLVIETENKIPNGFGRTWAIGLSSKKYIRKCGTNCLIGDFQTLPISNKISWSVKGDGKVKSDENTIILGEFELYKKMDE